jgi:hypothetical protein
MQAFDRQDSACAGRSIQGQPAGAEAERVRRHAQVGWIPGHIGGIRPVGGSVQQRGFRLRSAPYVMTRNEY